jgi:hypothetical protein
MVIKKSRSLTDNESSAVKFKLVPWELKPLFQADEWLTVLAELEELK